MNLNLEPIQQKIEKAYFYSEEKQFEANRAGWKNGFDIQAARDLMASTLDDLCSVQITARENIVILLALRDLKKKLGRMNNKLGQFYCPSIELEEFVKNMISQFEAEAERNPYVVPENTENKKEKSP